MSAISKYLIFNGYKVYGNDLYDSEVIQNLKNLGAKIYLGDNFKGIPQGSIIIYNSAIKMDAERHSYIKNLAKRVYTRAEFLSSIVGDFNLSMGISGCHGKTTATCMLANVLKCSFIKHFSHMGGEDLNLGNFSYTGKDVFLSEICEFKRNINYFTTDIACVLNVGLDHVDCYKNIDEIKEVYFSYLDRAKCAVINLDDEILANYTRRAVTYSLYNENANYKIHSINTENHTTTFSVNNEKYTINVLGLHNVYNAVNAIAVSKELGISYENIYNGLLSFKGVKRRFEKIGYINNAEVICDYAHHPDEIEATLKTVRENMKKTVKIIFQPHTYSRTKRLMQEFVNCFKSFKEVMIYKTYPAREIFDLEGSAEVLAKKIGENAIYFDNIESVKKHLHKTLESCDLLLVLGAGDIYNDIKNCLV